MTVVSGNLIDVSSAGSTATEVRVFAPAVRGSGEDTVLTEVHRETVNGGAVNLDLVPGLSILQVIRGGREADRLRLLVEDQATQDLEDARQKGELVDHYSTNELLNLVTRLTDGVVTIQTNLPDILAAVEIAETIGTSRDQAVSAAGAASTAAQTATTNATNAVGASGAAITAAELFSQYAADAEAAAQRAETVVESTAWSGDRLIVMGKIGPRLTGDQGDPGPQGDTPVVGANDNWWIGGVDTGVKARALDGASPQWDQIVGVPTDLSRDGHTHPATGISDSTQVGRNVLTSSNQANARSAIGAGTSSLALGTTSTTAARGNHTHTASDVGAAPADHTHTAAQVGAATEEYVNGRFRRVPTLPSDPDPNVLYLLDE